MTNLNNNELSARTNLHNFCNTVKAGLHNAVVSPSKRHALLVLLLLGAALCAAIYWPYHLPAALAGLKLSKSLMAVCWYNTNEPLFSCKNSGSPKGNRLL